MICFGCCPAHPSEGTEILGAEPIGITVTGGYTVEYVTCVGGFWPTVAGGVDRSVPPVRGN